MSIQLDNKQIARNTLFFFFLTILIMLVTLYTSRVVLNTLGVKDYGIYNAVGGVVAMFAVLTGALSSAISRYITYGLGKGDIEHLKLIFCTSVNVQVLLSIIVFILCEVVGVWFLNTQMNIPPERLNAANWVLHCSLVTFIINLLSVPYNACIIAHEHMKAFAYISILDALLKLLVVYMLIISPWDKLISYAILLVGVALVVRVLYGVYCVYHFSETKYVFMHDKKLFQEMLTFAGWNFLSNGASVLNTQGINVLINMYFGVIVNSARGIAVQVEGAINLLVNSFSTAINPQITKSYAQNEKQRMFDLICKGARFSFFLLLILSLPIMFEAEYVLKLWLKIVPEHTVMFVRLALVGIMVTTLGNTGYTACMATGNIRKYAVWMALVGSMVFFFTWIAFKLGSPVESTYIIYVVVYIAVQIVRLLIMRELLNFPIKLFVQEVILRITFPVLFSLIVPSLIIAFLPASFCRFVFVCIATLISTSLIIYKLGITSSERLLVQRKMKFVFSKMIRKA